MLLNVTSLYEIINEEANFKGIITLKILTYHFSAPKRLSASDFCGVALFKANDDTMAVNGVCGRDRVSVEVFHGRDSGEDEGSPQFQFAVFEMGALEIPLVHEREFWWRGG